MARIYPSPRRLNPDNSAAAFLALLPPFKRGSLPNRPPCTDLMMN